MSDKVENKVTTVDPMDMQIMLQVSEKVAQNPTYITLLQLSSKYVTETQSVVVESAEDEGKAADSLKAVTEALKLTEMLRKEQVDFPTKYCKVVNGMFKEVKKSFESVKQKLKHGVQKYRDKCDAERKAAIAEAERIEVEQAAETAGPAKPEQERSCATCAYANREATPWECGKYMEGRLTIIYDGFVCNNWSSEGAPVQMELPDNMDEGDPVALRMEPPPPPPPPENVVTGEAGGRVYTKKVWDYEMLDFGKFVRAVGSTKHPELVAENLLEVRRGELLKVIRREESPIRRISGLKIKQVKEIVGA